MDQSWLLSSATSASCSDAATRGASCLSPSFCFPAQPRGPFFSSRSLFSRSIFSSSKSHPRSPALYLAAEAPAPVSSEAVLMFCLLWKGTLPHTHTQLVFSSWGVWYAFVCEPGAKRTEDSGETKVVVPVTEVFSWRGRLAIYFSLF